MRKLIVASVAAAWLAATPTYAQDPTCSDLEFLNIEVHGQHIVRDYVTGGELDDQWPPVSMRDIIRDNGGAAVPGGPGPGFHFPNRVPPGASFCVDSQSWHSLGE